MVNTALLRRRQKIQSAAHCAVWFVPRTVAENLLKGLAGRALGLRARRQVPGGAGGVLGLDHGLADRGHRLRETTAGFLVFLAALPGDALRAGPRSSPADSLHVSILTCT